MLWVADKRCRGKRPRATPVSPTSPTALGDAIDAWKCEPGRAPNIGRVERFSTERNAHGGCVVPRSGSAGI